MTTLNPANIVPNELQPEDELGYKIIAVIGYNNDRSAYKGLTSWSDDEVARNGDKLSKIAAKALFYAPKAAGLVYRS